MSRWIWLIALLWVSACGWHLRGSQAGDSAVTHLHLSAADPYTLLYRTFQEEFQRRRISPGTDKTAPRLKLMGETISLRVISYNTELDPAEEEMTLEVHYQINDQTYRMEERKIVEKNKNRAAASENEKKILADLMRRSLADKILQQIARVTATPAPGSTARENLP